MKICLISDRFAPVSGGGGTTYAEGLANGLAEKNDVTVYTMNFGAKEEEKISGVKVKRLALKRSPWSSLGFFEFMRRVPKEIEKEDFDVIHATSASAAAFLPRKGFIVTSHGTALGELSAIFSERSLGISNLQRLLRAYFLELTAFHKSREVITTSNYLLNETRKNYFIKRKLPMIYYGVDLKKFRPANKEKKFALFVGRLSERKGITALLEAVKDLKVRVHIVGEGDYRKKIESFINRKGIKERIRLFGWLKGRELVNQFQECMFLVTPSNYEIFGITNIEAMACGKPVIGSNTGGIPEIIQDNFNGLLFEPGNSQELREKIDFLAKNPEKRRELGKNALKSVKRFAIEKSIEKHLKLYKEMK